MAAEVYRRTGREASIDANYVSKLERGIIRWPGEPDRAALRTVLRADTDQQLGLYPPRTTPPAAPAGVLGCGASNR